MGRIAKRNKWERLHNKYTTKSARELLSVFNSWNDAIEWDEMTDDNYNVIINRATDTGQLSRTYINIYNTVGTDYGKRTGKEINAQLKQFTLTNFITQLQLSIDRFFVTNGISRVVTIEETYKQTIANLLATRIEDGLTIREAAKEVQEIVGKRRFYRWQALRIARTETTAAANNGAIEAGKVSGFVMEKEWISVLDSRTRVTPPDKYDHRHMNGKRVGYNEKFNVSGQEMEYPGDPNASVGNVANCRCTIAVVPKRDSNGDLIPL